MQVCTLEANGALKVAQSGMGCPFQDIQVGYQKLWQNEANCKEFR